jgi:hypothetical protein
VSVCVRVYGTSEQGTKSGRNIRPTITEVDHFMGFGSALSAIEAQLRANLLTVEALPAFAGGASQIQPFTAANASAQIRCLATARILSVHPTFHSEVVVVFR